MKFQQHAISKGISLLAGVAGLYILFGIWFPVITKHHFESIFDIVFLFIFSIPVTCVAVYFLYTAGNLWKGISSRGINKLSVCLSIILAVLLLPVLAKIKPANLESDESFWMVMDVPIVMIIAGIFYLFLKKCIHKWYTIEEEYDSNAHTRATKLYFGFLAVFLWSSVSQISNLLPKSPGDEHVPANTWLEGLIIFGSIPFAWGFYRIGLKLFLKKPPVQMGQ